MNKRVKRGILLIVSLLLFTGSMWALLCVKNHQKLSQEGIYSQDVEGDVVQYDIRKTDGKWKLIVSENLKTAESTEEGSTTRADESPDVEYWGTGTMKADGSLYFGEMDGIYGALGASHMEFTVQFGTGKITGERVGSYINGENFNTRFVALKDDAYELDTTRTYVVAGVLGLMLIWVVVLSVLYKKLFSMKAVVYVGILAAAGCILLCAAFYGKDYSGTYQLRGNHEAVLADITKEKNGKSQVLITIGGKQILKTDTIVYSGKRFELPSEFAELYTFSEYMDRFPNELFFKVTPQGMSLVLKRDARTVSVPLASSLVVEPWWMALAYLSLPLAGGLVVGARHAGSRTRRGALKAYGGSYTLNQLMSLPQDLEYMKDYILRNRTGTAIVIGKKSFQIGETLYEKPAMSSMEGKQFVRKYPNLGIPKGTVILVIEPKGADGQSYYVCRQEHIIFIERIDEQFTLWEMEVTE